MTKKVIYILFILTTALTACDKKSISELRNEEIIISAYLYLQEPVTGIKISRPALDHNSRGAIINNASVSIRWKKNTFFLDYNESTKTYDYAFNNLHVLEGDTYYLNVLHEGKEYTATTIGPEEIRSINKSPDVSEFLIDPEISSTTELLQDEFFFTVSWQFDSASAYVANIKHLDIIKNPLFTSETTTPPVIRPFKVQPPGTNPVVLLFGRELKYWGKHELFVYSINNDYINYFPGEWNNFHENVNQDNPPGNINGARGLFTAFSRKSFPFEIKKEL